MVERSSRVNEVEEVILFSAVLEGRLGMIVYIIYRSSRSKLCQDLGYFAKKLIQLIAGPQLDLPLPLLFLVTCCLLLTRPLD